VTAGAPIGLGLLDFSWVRDEQSPAEALSDTLALAEHAEALGFSRYWIGEHHLDGHACGSPQVLAALLAASTRRIRIGVGAMLLYYWAPLKLAEDFVLLQSLFGRIDLGLGRGGADNPRSHIALLDGRSGTSPMLAEAAYGERVQDLLGHLRGTLPSAHPHHGAAVIPALDVMPEVWVCGSATAAPLAARSGTRFCCTLFHGRMAPPQHLAQYHETFEPSADLPRPQAAIAIAGTCADSDGEAQAMREAFPYRNYLPSVLGAPGQCRDRIEALCAEYGVREVLLLDIAPDRERRRRSAELLAQVFELGVPGQEA
jgi:luciferase family oxidoreductase group 1